MKEKYALLEETSKEVWLQLIDPLISQWLNNFTFHLKIPGTAQGCYDTLRLGPRFSLDTLLFLALTLTSRSDVLVPMF